MVVANPKAASSPAIASTTSLAAPNAGTLSATPAVTEASQPDASPNSAPTPNPATPPTAAPTAVDATPQWTAPGVALPSTMPTEAPTSGSGGTSPGDKTDRTGESTPKSVIAGAVVGSILGALVLGIGGVIAVKRHRDHTVYSRRAYTGDDDDIHGPGGRGGLMQEHRFDGGFASSEAYNDGKGLPDPVMARAGAGAGAGAFGAMAALLTPRKRNPANESPIRTRRLNMLDEEEAAADETWTDGDWARNKGWTRFHDEDDDAASPALGEVGILSLKGRGGMGVWDGFGGISRIGDTVRSSRSFLGGALGGFVGVAEKSDPRDQRDDDDDEKQAGTAYPGGDGEKTASSRLHEYGSVAPLEPQGAEEDPSLTPIDEWEEDDARVEEAGAVGPNTTESGDTYSAVSHTATSSETHRSRSTRRTSTEVSPTKSARIVRPFSPASASNASLYGSTFAAPQRFGPTTAVVEADLSRALSSTSHVSHRVLTRSNSSWWSRLNLQKNHHQAEVPTPTAAEAIRDPAPAPRMDAITVTDPFSDPDPVPSEVLEPGPPQPRRRRPDELDEHGRFATATERFARGVHDRSTSSNTSEATATSSVLEDRLRTMDVVQRVQSGGQSSAETTPTMGGNQHGGFEPSAMEYLDDPFRDPTQSAGAGGSDPRQRSPPRSATSPTPQRPDYVYRSPAKKIRVPTTTIQPPTPAYAPPDSPRKRLAGPRPEPLSPASGSTFALPRSNSVKDLIANIEKRASQPQDSASVAAAAAVDKAPSRTKVVHGFAKKPKLYVANPDAT